MNQTYKKWVTYRKMDAGRAVRTNRVEVHVQYNSRTRRYVVPVRCQEGVPVHVTVRQVDGEFVVDVSKVKPPEARIATCLKCGTVMNPLHPCPTCYAEGSDEDE